VHGTFLPKNFNVTALHFTSLHFTSLHFTSLHFTSKQNHFTLQRTSVMPPVILISFCFLQSCQVSNVCHDDPTSNKQCYKTVQLRDYIQGTRGLMPGRDNVRSLSGKARIVPRNTVQSKWYKINTKIAVTYFCVLTPFSGSLQVSSANVINY
jgi:hypothetical protein